MISTSDQILLSILVIGLFLVFGLPLGFASIQWFRRRQRRRLERSKRPIAIKTGPEIAPEPQRCLHRRSRSKAIIHPDGSTTSVCKWCDQPMKRNGPGDWEATGPKEPESTVSYHAGRD